MPITDENRADFERTRWQSLGDSQWIDVGFGNHPKNQNYLGAERDARLYRDSSRVIQLPEGMQMLIEQRHPETGLARGVPVGVNSGKHELWNREVYWRSKQGAEDNVITLISCAAGERYDPPRWTPRCTQEFSLPDMRMAVSVAYRKNLLPEWQAIEEKVSEHLQGFRMSTCSIRPGQDQ